jgi:putative chitinase
VWFWNKNGLNELADVQDIKAMTKRINGGYNGLEDRIALYKRVMSKMV